MIKILSLTETRKDLMKILEIPPNNLAAAEMSERQEAISVEFRFNLRSSVSNNTFFKNIEIVTQKYMADVVLRPVDVRGYGLAIELSITFLVGEVKP